MKVWAHPYMVKIQSAHRKPLSIFALLVLPPSTFVLLHLLLLFMTKLFSLGVFSSSSTQKQISMPVLLAICVALTRHPAHCVKLV